MFEGELVWVRMRSDDVRAGDENGESAEVGEGWSCWLRTVEKKGELWEGIVDYGSFCGYWGFCFR
jgi:hypothetical protein